MCSIELLFVFVANIQIVSSWLSETDELDAIFYGAFIRRVEEIYPQRQISYIIY